MNYRHLPKKKKTTWGKKNSLIARKYIFNVCWIDSAKTQGFKLIIAKTLKH